MSTTVTQPPELPPTHEAWPPETVAVIRAYLGLSAAALAQAVRVSDGRSVRRWLAGKHQPSELYRERMAKLVRDHARNLNRG